MVLSFKAVKLPEAEERRVGVCSPDPLLRLLHISPSKPRFDPDLASLTSGLCGDNLYHASC